MSYRLALLPVFYFLSLSLLPIRAAHALTTYTESTSADFSNSGLTPTPLTVSPGSNQFFGTTGRTAAAGPIDLDYLTFVVPSGYEWSALTELPGTQSGGSLSFIGVEAGDEVTVSPTASSAAGLLGWTHYNPASVGYDLLPFMGTGGLGSTGFTPPLAAGAYSLWIQDFNPGAFAYGFDIQITPVPEPESQAAGVLLLGIVIALASEISRLRS